MDIETGREFPFTNPQDDPHLYIIPTIYVEGVGNVSNPSQAIPRYPGITNPLSQFARSNDDDQIITLRSGNSDQDKDRCYH